MPSGLDVNTGARQVLNPGTVYVGGRLLGPTRGGISVTIDREYVQPEMDGVNQRTTGIGYLRSQQMTLEFSLVEFSPENVSLGSFSRTGTGTAPYLTENPFSNMTRFDGFASNIVVYWQILDTAVPGFRFVSIPTAMIQSQMESAADGTATMRVTVQSYVGPATPDAVGFSTGRVATIPAEVGGP